MRKAFVVASSLLLVAFALQFVFAAVGAFTKPAGGDGSYALHSITGMAVIPALTVLCTALALLSRAPGKVVGLAILPLGVVLLQVLLAALANALTDDAGATTPVGLVVGGLHAVNGIVAVHLVVGLVRAARRLAAPAAAASPAAPAGPASSAGPASPAVPAGPASSTASASSASPTASASPAAPASSGELGRA
ncbi:DUF6220 domain-containing protein [Actinoplanes sp. CA-142083]|uniref:DUF6220 domain-containing protein n=1 Tax=Actinoplanes sp. CA-142083 TaxID=3239903 RepID=UPI003D93CCD4